MLIVVHLDRVLVAVPLNRLLDVEVCLGFVLIDAPLHSVLVKSHLCRVLDGGGLGGVLIVGRWKQMLWLSRSG